MEERIWLMLAESGSKIVVLDECEQEIAQLDLDGTVMTIVPGLDSQALEQTAKATIRHGMGSLESGVWLEAFITDPNESAYELYERTGDERLRTVM